MQKRILQYFTNIKQQYGNYSRLFKLFKTDTAFYLYDVGTGKVMHLKKTENIFFCALIKYGNVKDALKEIQKIPNSLNIIYSSILTIEEQNLLKAPVITNFDIDPSKMLEKAENELKQITLEVTQQCNMRCNYCIYNFNHIDFRNFDTGHMSWDTAKKAIDYALIHSGKDLAVTFYGGEPLLEIDLIKQCVEYVQKYSKGKKISYSLTTNLTLMNKELALYFASIPNFAIVCSIDGAKEIHDENRVFLNNAGTFEKVIEGLKTLVYAYGNYADKLISISIVQAGILTREKLEKNNEFFNSLKWLPSVNKRVSYVRTSSNIEAKAITESEKFSYSNPIGDWTIDTLLHYGTDKTEKLYTHDFLEEHLSRIHNRILTEQPYPKYSMNGCCELASRKLYVTIDGNFHICERIGKSPIVGNVNIGLDKQSLVDKYIQTYCKESMPKCAECWAIRLCSVCYMDCYDENKFQLDLKEIACMRIKSMIERELVDYHTLLEQNPDYLNKINQLTLI